MRPNGRGLHVFRRHSSRYSFFKPIWSPDGRKVIAGCGNGVDNLCVIDVASRHVRLVVAGTAQAPVNQPAWGTHPRA